MVTLIIPTINDLDFIQWLWGDPDTMAAVGGPIALSDNQAQEWFEKMIAPGSQTDSYRLIIIEDQVPVGEVSYHRLDLDTMTADFNIKIAARYRGRGFARQAMLQFLETFFNDVGGRRIQDKVAPNNIAGKKALENFGFEYISSTEEYCLLELSKERFRELHGGDVRGGMISIRR